MSKLMFHLIISSSLCFLSFNCMNKSGQSAHTIPPLSTATSKAVSHSNDVVLDGCQEAVTLSKGEDLTIKLKATKGTGYVWQLKDPVMLLKSNDGDAIQYDQDPNEGKVGKASKQLLHFTAEKVGTESLNLVYLRPFDKDIVAEKCTIRVTIQ